MGDFLAQVGLGHLLHLAENHGGDLLGGELFVLSIDFDLDDGLAILVGDLVGEMLNVGLELFVLELAANQSPEGVLATVSKRKSIQRGDLT